MKRWTAYKGIASLLLVLVIAPLLVYRYALGGTVGKWRETGKLRRQTEQLRSSSHRTPEYQETVISDTEIILSGAVVAGLLPLIESEKLRIEHFMPCVTSNSDGVVLTTGQLSVQGKFTAIVKLLDELERSMPLCKIIATQYRSVKPRNRGSAKTLVCTIYIQQITAND